MERSALTAAILLALSACASQDTSREASTTAPATISESATTQSTSESSSGEGAGGEQTSTPTTAEASDSPVQIEGPAAPDFTFALADGSGFSLSDEQKPVYLVFWAEW